MVRSVLAEESLLSSLKNLSQVNGYEVGLIIGQTTGQHDYVIHMARTPRPASKDVKEESPTSLPQRGLTHMEPEVLKSVKDIHESWIAEHAKHVTRMLPGGVWVLGLFVIGEEDIFANADCMSRIRSTLVRMKKHMGTNAYLQANSPLDGKLVFFMSNKSHRFSCKTFGMDNYQGEAKVDWKFQTSTSKWHQIDCQLDIDQLFPISAQKSKQPLKKFLQEMLASVSDSINSAVCMIDGELRDSSELLDNLVKKKKSKSIKTQPANGRPLTASLYIPLQDTADDIESLACCGEMRFYGKLASRVFLHQKATIEEAVKAVKGDVIRSLAARLELHWDSLIEEEHGSPEEHITLHEPPRRVLVPLPHCKVELSDYLFPGEGASEALISLQELLDLQVKEEDVQKDLEIHADPSEYYTASVPIDADHSDEALPVQVSSQNVLLIGLTVAVGILAVCLALQFTGLTNSLF